MANIIETLDSIEGIKAGEGRDVCTPAVKLHYVGVAGTVRYDEDGHPVETPSARERADDLFQIIDKGSCRNIWWPSEVRA